MNENPDVKTAQALKRASEELASASYADRCRILALDKYANYLAYVNAGFSPEQALFLVK